MTKEALKKLHDVREDMFRETQENLPEEERCATYEQKECGVRYDGYVCTLPVGHLGPEHIAHGALGKIHFRWERRLTK